MKHFISSVNALKKGRATRKLRTVPRIAAIFLGLREEWVINLPNSFLTCFNF
jgi:hypothetical protein